jgi:hypothetical protein
MPNLATKMQDVNKIKGDLRTGTKYLGKIEK